MSKELIVSIEEGSWKTTDPDGHAITYEGFLVKTTDQLISLGINQDQQCCEVWGYFMTNDEPSDFIGAELLSVKLVDGDLRTVALKLGVDMLDCDDTIEHQSVMFVNIETNRGTLQFVAYNEHNGYYGHEAVVQSTQLNHFEIL